LRGLIQEKAPLAKLEETALAEGMQTLAVNGLERVKDGLTSLEEVVTSTTGE
jgi:type II secretory ATPase GspE/PulE/Tfp pilus assembly ATPase PilB-like protein